MIPQWLDIRQHLYRATFTFRALRSRNYAIYMGGMLASVIGTWIQIVATGWLVYRLTESTVMLGWVSFAGQIPSLLVTPIAGVYADRLNRRKVIIGTQCASMLLSFLLGYLVISDQIEIWHLLTIAVLNGVTNAIDTPFRHSFIRDLTADASQMQNAIALNSMLFNTARFVGPVIGGILIGLIGEGYCFVINGLSFFGVIASLLLIRVNVKPIRDKAQSVIADLKEGIRYSFGHVSISVMLILVISAGLFCLPFQSFLPVFARDILHGDSHLFGLLTGAYGAGALSGALFLASRKSLTSLPSVILIAAITFSVGLMIFSMSGSVSLSIIILIMSGWGMIAQYTSVNTVIQTIADPAMTGRALSFYGMSFMTVTPLGALAIGSLSAVFDIRWVIFGSALLSLAAIMLFATRKKHVMLDISASQKNHSCPERTFPK